LGKCPLERDARGCSREWREGKCVVGRAAVKADTSSQLSEGRKVGQLRFHE
jgi:hypothetical protein